MAAQAKEEGRHGGNLKEKALVHTEKKNAEGPGKRKKTKKTHTKKNWKTGGKTVGEDKSRFSENKEVLKGDSKGVLAPGRKIKKKGGGTSVQAGPLEWWN